MYALEIENLKKVYAGDVLALNDVSLKIKHGDFYGLLGPNGAGKTTIIGIISSLVQKTSGKVSIYGVDIERDFSKAKSFLGVVPQEFNLAIFETVTQILLNQAGYYGIRKKDAMPVIEKYLKMLGLWDKRNTIVKDLSGGMKRRLIIARALIHEPSLIILDEPTAGVDVELRHHIWELLEQLNREGKTIILTTHYLEEAEHLCKDVGIIRAGSLIAEGSMKDILNSVNTENYIISLAVPVNNLGEGISDNITLLDDTTIEVNTDVETNIGNIINSLVNKGLEIKSIKNKRNRLEEIFLQLTRA